MNAQKLIARRMLEEYPLKIARKNYYKDKNDITFKGCAVKWSEIKDFEERKNDLAFAREAENFLKSNDFAFLVGCQFDLGKLTWIAWRAPLRLAKDEDVGKRNMKPRTFAKMNMNSIAKILRRNKLGSRNLPHLKAAKNLKALSKMIVDEYGGKAKNIWEKSTSFEDLYDSFISLPGFGLGLTNMTLKILLANGMIPQIPKTSQSKAMMQVKPDIHVCRVFYRTGIADNQSERAALTAAKEYAPDFPMSLDSAGYTIGTEYCYKNDPDCEDCLLAFKADGEKLCPRVGFN